MRSLAAALAVLSLARLDPCGAAEEGTTQPGPNAAGNPAAPGDPAAPNQPGGGTGGRCGAKATGNVCASFVGEAGWTFATATSYEPGRDPKVSSMSGTAVFGADGKFVEDYRVGSLTFVNHYEGTYQLDGRFLTGKTTEGETVEYIISCDDAEKALAITIPNPDADCSPSLIFGLKLNEKK